jgi:uncharacterized protein YecA (UPF0149 family)
MSRIPIFCENPQCGTIFPSFISFGGNASFTSVDSKMGPCPNCGSYGVIPDGVFNFAEKSFSLFNSSSTSLEKLQVIESVLRELGFKNNTKDNVISQINEIDSQVAEILRRIPSSSNYKQWISLALTLLALLIAGQQAYFNDSEKKHQLKEEMFYEKLLKQNEELIKITKNTNEHLSAKDSTKISNTKRKKIGRNEPCFCGSGKKYKKCHLLIEKVE